MEPPPSVLVSFSDTLETRVCGRDTCQRTYITCTQDEKTKWGRVSNARNTNGDITRWVCGECMDNYMKRPSTRRRGAKVTFTQY